MENISYDALEKIGYKGYLLPKDAPEKVLQFGEGNFLRAFVDRFFDMGNEATGWNGKIVMVQPISGAFGFADGINAQDDLYTVLVRGKEDGNTVDESRVISACSRCINPYREDDYRAMMQMGSRKTTIVLMIYFQILQYAVFATIAGIVLCFVSPLTGTQM